MQALKSDAPLIVYIDVKSPYAFVAMRPTLALERELGLQFDWRPLTLDIPSYLGSAEKKRRKSRLVQGAQRENLERHSVFLSRRAPIRRKTGPDPQGHRKNLEFQHREYWRSLGSKNDRDKLGCYLEAVYPPFWRRELDIEDVAVVERCLEQAGVDAGGFVDFQAGEGRAAHDALQVQFHPSGIYGVPTYVLSDGDVLFGREHIPYIRWALSGRDGPAPDIAYEIGE